MTARSSGEDSGTGVASAPAGGWSTEQLVDRFPKLGPVTIEPVSLDGPNGPVPARLYRGPEIVSAFVWAHGGAFAFGDLDMPEAHWVSLALASRGIAVCSVDYRLAIAGVHFPVPGDDVHAAWRWAIDDPGFAPAGVSVHLGGASAGGCLAASVVKRVRDRGEPLPTSVVLVYPLAHAELPEPGPELRRTLAAAPPDAFLFDADLTRELVLNYVGDEGLFEDPDAFPANGDHRGLPPTLIVNAEYDTLRASGEVFGAALAAAGVEVVVETEPGTAHGHINDPTLAAAHRTVDRIASWITSR